jgi:hypothetical protein
MRTVVRKLHGACEYNDIQQVSDILKSFTIEDLDRAEKDEENTALNIASQNACHEIVRMLLEHGDSMMKRNRYGLTPFNQAKDERIRQIFAQYQHPLPRFAGDLLEWTIAYREPAIKRAQIREYLARNQFVSDSFEAISRRYVCCYLALEGFSTKEIDQLESIGYTSVDGFIRAYTSPMCFHKYINRHLATYALAYFDSSFDMSIPYSFIYCLLSIVASILHTIRFRTSFIGHVYRGMLITQDYLDKYVVGSRILNTAFLSTSTNRTVAEIFAGINKDDTSPAQSSSHVKVLCTYAIRNRKTAYDIEHLSNIQSESEVLIFPFSAFHVIRVQKTSSGSVEIDLNECDEGKWSDDDDNNDAFDTLT